MNQRDEAPKISASKVTMPSGGGALRGISEPFKAQSFTGSGSFAIPFSLPHARGFSPSISLSYSSGSGNGIYGLGFSLQLGSIVRKTSNGVPKYDSTDVFILAGAGELLPKYDSTENGYEKSEYTYTNEGDTWHIVAYRPRVEGTFSLIEQWTNVSTALSYWKVLSADNITSLYGISDSGRIYNPQHPEQIFEWLLETSYDAHGNKVEYTYRPGDTVNIPESANNIGRDYTSQRYPDTIFYGNYFDENSDSEQFAFEVVFDYGQLNRDNPNNTPTDWSARADIFSSYKSGFEVRTARLCHGIYLRHNFPEEENGSTFTAALLPEYDSTEISGISVVKRIVSRGYRLQEDDTLWVADMPATELDYQDFDPLDSNWKILEANAPGYLNSNGFIAVDLYGVGIDGLLYSTDNFTGYLEPLGNGHYAPMRTLEDFPIFRNMQKGQVSFTSLEGNNVLDLLVSDGITNGFFEQSEYKNWSNFQSFNSFPEEYFTTEKELVDLSGTGRNDLLLYDNMQLKHYASVGKKGFENAVYSYSPSHFPTTTQQSEEEIIGFSDFIGDGLAHRFRLKNGNLTVWPCLGHGNFGEPVELGNAPCIEGLLDSSCLFLVDADGSGATDIIYCYPGYARVWFNQNGSSFLDPVDIVWPDTYSSISSVTAGDVCGYGTAALIFTTTDPDVRHYYYDFSNNKKPYLLQTVDNGVGGLSSLTYTTSVLEYLHDKKEGREWPTRLPMPVSVVRESSVTDQITGATYTERYRYHDGFFDPIEKEFRGFGYVESWDCESYEDFQANSSSKGALASMINEELWVPPVYTRSWFITGAYEQTPVICKQYESEFFRGDAQQWEIPAIELEAIIRGESAITQQQAYSSLAGQVIRTEVYAEDDSALANSPYSVSMSTSIVHLVQPILHDRYCSVMPRVSNELSYTYDRNIEDPLISQSLTLAADEYGNTLLSASINFPRRNVSDAIIYPEQQRLRVLVGQTEYINDIHTSEQYPDSSWQHIGVGWQGSSYEIKNLTAPSNGPYTQRELLPLVETALNNITENITSEPSSDLLGRSCQVYWDSDGVNPLPYGEVNSLALLHHGEQLVMSPEEVSKSYGDKVSDTMLSENCGYMLRDGYWWNYGQMQLYNWNENQFYTPSGTQAAITGLSYDVMNDNGFNGTSAVTYDRYYLNIIETSSSLSDTVTLTESYTYDYELMAPVRSTDVNQNISELLYDPLGQVIATTIYGQIEGKDVGDLSLSEYNIMKDADFDDVIANPQKFLQGATTYFYYDLHAWKDRQQPASSVSISRSLHVHQLEAEDKNEDDTLMPLSVTYSDGLGNVLQAKSKTSPGNVVLRKEDGTIVTPSTVDTTVLDRWVVSGRTVYNNKGLPVEQYEPYFSATPDFEDQQEIVDQKLVPPPTVIHYDPIGRVIRTDSPKGFFSKAIYTPWETKTYDFNDTILDSPYYQWLISEYSETSTLWEGEQLIDVQAAIPCYNTPATAVLDNLGNPIRSIKCNLGAITVDTIPQKVASPMTQQQVWDALLEKGYLVQQNTDEETAWVSKTFQPYTPGFHEQFLEQFPDNGIQIEDYLAQSCMTSLSVYDVVGQQLYSTDPRLFLKMVREETVLYNFRSEYSTGGQVLKSESADAGTRWSLTNIAGNTVFAWDSKGQRSQSSFDNLQRSTGVYAISDDGTLNNQVQVTVYGEVVTDAANHNLMGRAWKDYDEAGLSVIKNYNLGGLPLAGETFLRADYKSEANWTTQAQQDVLDTKVYNRSSIYNAAGQLIAEVLPDGSINAYVYDINGRLSGSRQQVVNELSEQTEWKNVINTINYDANSKRTKVVYGNGVVARYSYDMLTQQLVRAYIQRSNEDTLQDIFYTYDPVGNKITTLDRASKKLFNKNQIVEPKEAYTYDPLYRIIKAEGKTLSGLNEMEQQIGEGNDVSQYRAAQISDLQNQINYTELFSYDFGDNMVLKRYVANGSNRSQVMTINDENNHLATMFTGNPSSPPASLPQYQYDGNGNMVTLNPNSSARVSWNYLNQVANVINIAREITNPETGNVETLNDGEYYQYNTNGTRVRKVTEQVMNGGTQILYTEKIYLGSYQQTRSWTAPVDVTPNSNNVAIQSEKKTLMINDGSAPVLITHVWVIAPPHQSEISAGEVQYRYQICNTLDSVTIEVNEDATVLSYEQYYVYGGTSFTLARSQLEAASKELRFCGKERDQTTGLYYYGARYYAEWLCRWISPDPAGPVDGPNLYEYVSSNPVNYNDPTGLSGVSEDDDDSANFDPNDPDINIKDLIGKKRSSSGKSGVAAKKSKSGLGRADFDAKAILLGEQIVAEEIPGSTKFQAADFKKEIKGYNPSFKGQLLYKINKREQNVADINSVYKLGIESSSEFSVQYRGLQKAQDELVSTSIVYYLLQGVAKGLEDNKNDLAIDQVKENIRSAFQFVSYYRMPTYMMGHNTGTGEHVQHISTVNSLYGNPTANGKQSVAGHPDDNDLERISVGVLAGESSTRSGVGRLFDLAQACLSYTVNEFAAPPFASNNIVNTGITDAKKEEATLIREAAKAQIKYTPLGTDTNADDSQNHDAIWNRGTQLRGRSPRRKKVTSS